MWFSLQKESAKISENQNIVATQFVSLPKRGIRSAARAIRWVLPLSARKAIVASRMCRAWGRGGFEFSIGLLDDLRHRDPEALHRFLWSKHLAYARTYEVSRRFGASNVNPSRHILFNEMAAYLSRQGVDPRMDIRSIFEVGCSTGHLLRHLESEVFPSAQVLHGLDIDQYAIGAGMAHLRSLNSRVKLFTADMTAVAQIMGDQAYDVVLCCGVLMYVREDIAEQTIRAMLSRAHRLMGIICLAHPKSKGSTSNVSVARFHDGAFMHNVHRMIVRSGGRIVCSRWVGTEVSGSSPSHAILAVPC
jgi:SAM-dependent methyltransferase